MRNEVRQRIEQIRQGKVPADYKKTKHGIFPKEWEIGPVGDLIQEYKSFSNDIESMPVYSSSRNGLIRQAEYYDRKESQKTNLGYKVVPPEYVTYRHMSDDDIFHFNINTTGESILVSAEYPVFRSNGHSDLNFLIPLLNNSPQFRYFCRTQKLGGTRTRLYFRVLETYEIIAPCLEEQQKIAKILMTQDRVIALREKLLAEKLRQKQYLMQVLLTGKKRLPGFTGEWNYVQMKTLGTTYSGLSGKNKEDFGKGQPYIPYINIYSNAVIDTNNFDYVRIEENEKQNLVKYGDIFFTTSSETSDEVGMSSVLLEKVDNLYLNSFCFGFRLHNFLTLLPQYAVYYFRGGNFRRILNSLAQGSTRFNLSKNNLLKAMLLLPPIKEQQAIVEILRAIDREINLLRQALEQERQKKKALMQLLLLGIVRVKP